MGNFKRFTIVVGVIIGATWYGLTGKRQKANEEIFHGFRQLGGVYVKFLQILSLKKTTFFGSWDSAEAMAVYDAVKTDEIDVHAHIARELTPVQLLDIVHIEPLPFAAGSFGQVYYGQHRDGKAIIIKVLRPNLVQHIKLDLKVLRVVAAILKVSLRQFSTDFSAIFKDFRKVIIDEIDYRQEANHANYFYNYFHGHSSIVIPKTYMNLSTGTMIVQEYIGGMPMTELMRAKDDGEDPEAYVQQRLGSNLLKQMEALGVELTASILTADRILGDPHPGNIKLLENNQIGLYDFGITGDPPKNRRAFMEVMKDFIAIYKGDFDPGKVFIDCLRFFAQDLFRAISTVARAIKKDDDSFDLIAEVENLARKVFEQNKSRIDMDYFMKHGHIGWIMNRIVNENNRFAIRAEFDSSVMIRAADGYLNMLSKLELRDELIPHVFETALGRLDKQAMFALTGKSESMQLEEAVDIVSNWVQDMFENDPIFFRSFMYKYRRSAGKKSE